MGYGAGSYFSHGFQLAFKALDRDVGQHVHFLCARERLGGRTQIFMTTAIILCVKPRPFLHDRGCYLDEKRTVGQVENRFGSY